MPWELRTFACIATAPAVRGGSEFFHAAPPQEVRYWPTVLFWTFCPAWFMLTAAAWVAFVLALKWQAHYDLWTCLFAALAMLGTIAIVLGPLGVAVCCPPRAVLPLAALPVLEIRRLRLHRGAHVQRHLSLAGAAANANDPSEFWDVVPSLERPSPARRNRSRLAFCASV